MFQLSVSTRYGESRAAYREVQDRHEDIKRIERTLEELAQMFNDVSVAFLLPFLCLFYCSSLDERTR